MDRQVEHTPLRLGVKIVEPLDIQNVSRCFEASNPPLCVNRGPTATVADKQLFYNRFSF